MRSVVRPVLLGIGVLVVAAAIVLAVAQRLSSGSGVEVNVGSDVFVAGDARRLAASIERDGEPLLFAGLLRDLDIRVSHTGDDPFSGWRAFAARAPEHGDDRTCNLTWLREDREFVDPCTEGGPRYPADGTGLERFPASVDAAGRLVIDLTPDGEPGGLRGVTSAP